MKHNKRRGKFGNRMRRKPKVTKTPTGNLIRLRDFYPDYEGKEQETEVSDEVLACMMRAFDEEHNYCMELCRHYVPLPFDEQIMGELYGITAESPQDIVEKQELMQRLHHALMQIDPVLSRRFCLYYESKMSLRQIADMEDVTYKVVWRSIRKAVDELYDILNDFDE